MKKIITSLLLGMALLAMVVSCSNNASGAKTNGSNVPVFEATPFPGVSARIKGYENLTWEQEVELASTKQTTVVMKGTHNIDLTKDGTYQIKVTHIQDTYFSTLEPDDPNTWGSLVDFPAAMSAQATQPVSLEENGTKLILNKGETSEQVYTRK